MDIQNTLDKLQPVIKSNLIPLALGLLGMIFFIYGLIGLLGSSSSSKGLVFEPAITASQSGQLNSIMVDIEGAVVRPGVYSLPLNSRIQDGFIAAGGLSVDADREKVAKSLNLASKLSDGAKLYIPKMGESAASVIGAVSEAGVININTASSSELDSLPGVGQATAEKIINNRPYGSLEELVSKKAVTQKVFDGLKDKIAY